MKNVKELCEALDAESKVGLSGGDKALSTKALIVLTMSGLDRDITGKKDDEELGSFYKTFDLEYAIWVKRFGLCMTYAAVAFLGTVYQERTPVGVVILGAYLSGKAEKGERIDLKRLFELHSDDQERWSHETLQKIWALQKDDEVNRVDTKEFYEL